MDLKVLSFNVRTCDDANGHAIKERAPRAIEILKKENADIMGFQEYTPETKKFFQNELSQDYEIFDKYRTEKPDTDWESEPIFWKKDKFRCLDKGFFWFSDTPEKESTGWDEIYDCYRICMWIILKEVKTGKSFIHMNTHLGFGNKGQCDSVKLIKKFIENLGNLPAIITGDFNFSPDTEPYRIMTEDYTDVNVATVNDKTVTYHGYSVNPKKEQEHIDFCFVNDGVVSKDFKIITKTFDGKFPSDHYPIVANVSL